MDERAFGNFKVPIEVPALLYFFATTFSDSICKNLIIFRTCYVSLGYNKSECALLGSNKTDNETAKLEEIVEPYSALLNMVNSLTGTACSAVICLFVGPWSDRFGRKPILIIPVIGYVLYFVLYAIFAALEKLSPWYSLICSIPLYLTGGGSPYVIVLLCYIADITDETNRGVRMGVFEAVLLLGIFLGNSSSSFVFLATDYWTVFLISASCCFLNVLFTVFFIPESLANPEPEGRFRGLFQLTNIRDMVKTTFRKRRNCDRFIVLSCVLSLNIYILAIVGDGTLAFLYVREKFHWSLKQYTLYSAAYNVVCIFGALVGTYLFHKLFKIPESVMIVIGFSSMCFGMLALGLAQYDWEIYAASFSRALGGVLSAMVRSLVSKVVPNEEVGKIFALIVVSENLFTMAGSPLFTFIYNATISTDPAMFNFVCAGLYVVDILIAIAVVVARRLPTDDVIYQEIENAYDAEECRDEAVP